MNETGGQYLPAAAVTFGDGFGIKKVAEQKKGFFVYEPKPVIKSLEPFGAFKQANVPKFGFDKVFAGYTSGEQTAAENVGEKGADSFCSSSISTDRVQNSCYPPNEHTARSESSSAAQEEEKSNSNPQMFDGYLTPPQGDAWQNDEFQASESVHQEQRARNATPSQKERQDSAKQPSPQAPAYPAVQSSARLPDSLTLGVSQRSDYPNSFASLAGQISATSRARLNIQDVRLRREADELQALLTRIKGSIAAAQRQARARDDELHDFVSVMHRSKRSVQSQKALLAVISWLCLLGGVFVLFGV